MRFIMAAAVLAAVCAAHAGETWQGRCDVEFRGSAPMDRFRGKAEARPFDVDVSDGENGAKRAAWTVEVSPGGMTTFKKARDREMHEMFHVAEFPLISGVASNVDLPGPDGGQQPVMIPFSLTMHGVTRPMTAAVSNYNDSGDRISFDASFVVSVKSFNLRPPVLMGMIHVRDTVPVVCHFVFSRHSS